MRPLSRGAPDFIIAGAPRSGTTWLYEVLGRHPQIYMAWPSRPEPKFFLVDSEFRRGLDYYRDKWFKDAPAGMVSGEKTTNYLESDQAASRIAESLPDVRLIFVLREPASRALSNYLWSRMNGLETQSFSEALRLEPEREATYDADEQFARPFSYFSRGLYARHLSHYLSRFPSEHILVLRFEDLAGSPGRVAAAVHEFLGVSRRPIDGERTAQVNSAEGERSCFERELRDLRTRYLEPNRQLSVLLSRPFWEY